MSGPTTVSAPASVTTATGFIVNAGIGGSGAYGVVSWQPTGHAQLTPTGLAALANQIASYHGAFGSLANSEQISLHGPAGMYSVANADLAAQVAAIAAVLATAANVTGKAS